MRTRAKRAREEVTVNVDDQSNDGPPLTQIAMSQGVAGGKYVTGFTPAAVSDVLATCCKMLEAAFRTDFSSAKVIKENDIHTAVQSPYHLLFHHNPTHSSIYK